MKMDAREQSTTINTNHILRFFFFAPINKLFILFSSRSRSSLSRFPLRKNRKNPRIWRFRRNEKLSRTPIFFFSSPSSSTTNPKRGRVVSRCILDDVGNVPANLVSHNFVIDTITSVGKHCSTNAQQPSECPPVVEVEDGVDERVQSAVHVTEPRDEVDHSIRGATIGAEGDDHVH